jgi:hypothetical protein
MNKSVLQAPGGTVAPIRGRLVYALDATASREAGWAIARRLQADMFRAAGPMLSLQLVYYGGSTCRASRWAESGEQLARWMDNVHCESGLTQIARVLQHCLREREKAPIQAITFVGDCVEESVDALAALAAELGAAGVPLHMFQEGRDPAVTKAFRLLALKSGGTYAAFNPAVPETIERLSAQLNEVARLAVSNVAAIGTSRR